MGLDSVALALGDYHISLTYEAISLTTLSANNNSRGSGIDPVGISLNVDYQYNYDHPDLGGGMCWAATVASIGNYKTGRSSTSLDVYSWLKNESGVSVLGKPYPVGDPAYVIAAFNQFYGLNYHYFSFGATFDTVYRLLEQNIPIYAAIARTGGAHTVAICGATFDGYSYYYTFVDPNISSKVTVEVEYNSFDFTYVSGSRIYTDWYQRFN